MIATNTSSDDFDYGISRSVASRLTKRFPRWDLEEIVAEIWLYRERAKLPNAVAHHHAATALWDEYCKQWHVASRNTIRRGGRTDLVVNGEAFESAVEMARFENPDFYQSDFDVYRRRSETLTTQEWEVTYHRYHGRSNKTASKLMGVSSGTADNRWASARRKMGAAS